MAKTITEQFVKTNFPKRIDNSNKSTYGKVLNIAGSSNYRGAAYLSSASCLRIGAGLVCLASVEKVCNSVSALLPEVIFQELSQNNVGSISKLNNVDLYGYQTVLLGCGLTTNEETSEFLLNLFDKMPSNKSLVVDADAINILAKNNVKFSTKNIVLTPHVKELSRLLNVSVEEINDNREKYAMIAAQKFECVVLLKGNKTVITNGEEVYINSTGNSALAKAGTGDVLTGIIGGLISQSVDCFKAAIIGAYIHGLAGDLMSEELTKYSVLASDVVEYIPFAVKQVLENE